MLIILMLSLPLYAVIFKECKFHKLCYKFVKYKFLSLKNSSKSAMPYMKQVNSENPELPSVKYNAHKN